MKKFIVTWIVLCSVLCMNVAFADQDADARRAQIESRIKPIGQVRLAGDVGEASAKQQATAATQKFSAKAVYNQTCAMCHAAGVAGAPKLGDKSAWKVRLTKGMDKVLEKATKGFNAMPPKGNCPTCSQEELKAIITYMSSDNS